MPEVGLTGFLSALAQSVAGDVVAKDKLNSQKHLLDEDITRLAESAAFIWNKTVEEYKGQEHDLVSEFLGAEPDPLALVAANLATAAGIPSVFLLRVQQLARGKLRRPGDPDGKCCPVRYSFTIPESMAQILPRRLFERGSGDRVGKYQLVALVDSARMHDTWLAISASEPEKTFFVRFFYSDTSLSEMMEAVRERWDVAMDWIERFNVWPSFEQYKINGKLICQAKNIDIYPDMQLMECAILGECAIAFNATGFYPLENFCREKTPILDLDKQNNAFADLMESLRSVEKVSREPPLSIGNILSRDGRNLALDPWISGTGGTSRKASLKMLACRLLVGGEPTRTDESIIKDCVDNLTILPEAIFRAYDGEKLSDELNNAFISHAYLAKVAIDFLKTANNNAIEFFRNKNIDINSDLIEREKILGFSKKYDINMTRHVNDNVKNEAFKFFESKTKEIITKVFGGSFDVAAFFYEQTRTFASNYLMTSDTIQKLSIRCHNHLADTLPFLGDVNQFAKAIRQHVEDKIMRADEIVNNKVVFIKSNVYEYLKRTYDRERADSLTKLITPHIMDLFKGSDTIDPETIESIWEDFDQEFLSDYSSIIIDDDLANLLNNRLIAFFQKKKMFLSAKTIMQVVIIFKDKIKTRNKVHVRKPELLGEFMTLFDKRKAAILEESIVPDICEIVKNLVIDVFTRRNLYLLREDLLDFRGTCLKELAKSCPITPNLIEQCVEFFRQRLKDHPGIIAPDNQAPIERLATKIITEFLAKKKVLPFPDVVNKLCDNCLPIANSHFNEIYTLHKNHIFLEVRSSVNNASSRNAIVDGNIARSVIEEYLVNNNINPSSEQISLLADDCLPERRVLSLTISGCVGHPKFPLELKPCEIDFCWIPPGTSKIGGTSFRQLMNQSGIRDHVQHKGFWISKHMLTYRAARFIIDKDNGPQFLNNLSDQFCLLRFPNQVDQRPLPVHSCQGNHSLRYWDFIERPDDCQAFLDFPATCMQMTSANAIIKIFNNRARSGNGIKASMMSLTNPSGQDIPTRRLRFRLPASSEWEYALRGGPLATNPRLDFHFHDDWNVSVKKRKQYNFNNADFGGIEYLETGGGSRVVSVYRAGLMPNLLGIMGMQGNAWELTSTIHPDGSPIVRGGDNRCNMHEAACCFEKSLRSLGFNNQFTESDIYHGVALRIIAEEID